LLRRQAEAAVGRAPTIWIARIGNDTDTNAATAGGLLGARDGSAAIPERWTATLQFAAEFEAAAAILAGSPV